MWEGFQSVVATGAEYAIWGVVGSLARLAWKGPRPTGWDLLWELPAALGGGSVGGALAVRAGVPPGVETWATIFLIAFGGPPLFTSLLKTFLRRQ